MNKDTDNDGFGITPPKRQYNLRSHTPRFRISPPRSTSRQVNTDRNSSLSLDSNGLPSPGFSDSNSDTSTASIDEIVINTAKTAPVSNTPTLDRTAHDITTRATDDDSLSSTLTSTPNPVTKTEPDDSDTLTPAPNPVTKTEPNSTDPVYKTEPDSAIPPPPFTMET